MQNFIVLGIIPGTDLQITFTAWVYMLLFTAVYVSRYRLWAAYEEFRHALIICLMAWTIERGEPPLERMPFSLHQPLA